MGSGEKSETLGGWVVKRAFWVMEIFLTLIAFMVTHWIPLAKLIEPYLNEWILLHVSYISINKANYSCPLAIGDRFQDRPQYQNPQI